MNSEPQSFRPNCPFLAVDMLIEIDDGLVLIERKNEPYGWALPGGFVDYGESVETAAKRETKEETGLDVQALKLFGCYSDPKRDPRFHTASVVYICQVLGQLKSGDDAKNAIIVPYAELPKRTFVFDHSRIIRDYLQLKLDK